MNEDLDKYSNSSHAKLNINEHGIIFEIVSRFPKNINTLPAPTPHNPNSSHNKLVQILIKLKIMIQTSYNMVSESRNSILSDIACVTNVDTVEFTSKSMKQSVEDIFGSCWREVLGIEKFKSSVVDEWYQHILEINFFEIVGLASANEDENKFGMRLSRVPLSFKSSQHYFNIFQPLVLEEFKAQLQSTFWETSYPWEKMYHGTLSVLLLEKVGSFYLVTLVHHDDDGDSTPFEKLSKNDLVLLTKQPPGNDSCNDLHLVGKVEEFQRYNDKKMSVVKIRFYFRKTYSRLHKAKSMMKLEQPIKWHACRIMSITPQLREFLALSLLQDIGFPICSVILKNQHCGYRSFNEMKELALNKLSQPLQQVLKSSFNVSQLQAISASIRLPISNKGFELSLIQGPPGTGKTHTIVGVVSCLLSLVQTQNSTQNFQDETPNSQLNEEENSLSRGRVLICAQSNAAVDELVSRISSTGLYGDDGKMYMPYIVRVGNAQTTHPNSMPFFIDTLVDHCLAEEIMQLGIAKNDSIKQFCETLYIYKNILMTKISKYKVKCAKTSALEGDGVKEMSNAEAGRLYYQKKELIVKDLSAAQAQDFMSENENINTLKLMLRKAIIRQANIVFATLNGCGGDVYRFCYVPELLELSKNLLFDAVVIDEAAQALESATLIPLQLLKAHGSKCIMVGDPKQLPATVMSKVASKFLYGRSMFERLQRAGFPVTILTKQYRMHPEISRFPSMQFYHVKLLNGENMSRKSAPFHESLGLGPYLFYDVVDGKELQGKSCGGFSLSNEHEAEAAVDQLNFFKKRYPSEFQSRRFGIITPYKSQLSLMRSCFSSAFEPSIVANMEFHTVDGFQGREVDIVILSTVRAAEANPSSIGFVADVRRMNVALTRAKISLWIFGNARTLQINYNWAALLRDAKQRNLVISVLKPLKTEIPSRDTGIPETSRNCHSREAKHQDMNRKSNYNNRMVTSNDHINFQVRKSLVHSRNLRISSSAAVGSVKGKAVNDGWIHDQVGGSEDLITKKKHAMLHSSLNSSKKPEPSMKRVPAKRPRAWSSVASNGIRISKRRKEYHGRLDRGKHYESMNYARS